MEGKRIIYPARSGSGQGARPRAADIETTSAGLSSHPHRSSLFIERSVSTPPPLDWLTRFMQRRDYFLR